MAFDEENRHEVREEVDCRCGRRLAVRGSGPGRRHLHLPREGAECRAEGQGQVRVLRLGEEADGVRPHEAAPGNLGAAPPEQDPRGGALSGAAKGAAVGAVGGAIGGNAGKGAAIGALAGGVLGGARRRHQAAEQQAAQQQWADQQATNYQQQRSSWERAAKACLTGRGYTIQ